MWQLAALVFSLSLYPARADSALLAIRDPHQNYFTNPPGVSPKGDFQDDNLYHRNDLLNVTWVTDLPSVDLILCQPALDGNDGQTRLQANTTQRWFPWNVTESDVVVHSGPVGSVFYFQITPPNQIQAIFNSHYFNVTAPLPGSSPSVINPAGSITMTDGTKPASSPSSASDNSTSPSTTNHSSTSSLSSEASSADSASSATLSAGSVVAISIGAALFAGAFAGVLTWWLCVTRHRRRQQSDEKGGDGRNGTNKTYSTDSTASLQRIYVAELNSPNLPREIGSTPLSHEMPAQEAPVELPAWEIAKGGARESRSDTIGTAITTDAISVRSERMFS